MKIADVTPILIYFVLPLLLGILLWIGFMAASYWEYRATMAQCDLDRLRARLRSNRADDDGPDIISIDTAFEGRKP